MDNSDRSSGRRLTGKVSISIRQPDARLLHPTHPNIINNYYVFIDLVFFLFIESRNFNFTPFPSHAAIHPLPSTSAQARTRLAQRSLPH